MEGAHATLLHTTLVRELASTSNKLQDVYTMMKTNEDAYEREKAEWARERQTLQGQVTLMEMLLNIPAAKPPAEEYVP